MSSLKCKLIVSRIPEHHWWFIICLEYILVSVECISSCSSIAVSVAIIVYRYVLIYNTRWRLLFYLPFSHKIIELSFRPLRYLMLCRKVMIILWANNTHLSGVVNCIEISCLIRRSLYFHWRKIFLRSTLIIGMVQCQLSTS
jgi:hypothetical protein